jgi:hypothetical protein
MMPNDTTLTNKEKTNQPRALYGRFEQKSKKEGN